MAKEIDIESRFIGSTVKLEICRKVLKKYRINPGESDAIAYARALEDSVRDVILNVEDEKWILEEKIKNAKKREIKRLAKKGLSQSENYRKRKA